MIGTKMIRQEKRGWFFTEVHRLAPVTFMRLVCIKRAANAKAFVFVAEFEICLPRTNAK